MAPNTNKGAFKPKTERDVPVRFRCKVGGEWKSLDAFSGSQQKLIRWNSGKIDAARSGITCLEHAAKSRTEIRCDVCTLIKPRDQFSKSALKNEEYICSRCIAWTETQEPTVVPAPLETGHISVEETNTDVWETGFVDSNDFFDDDGLPHAPISGLASLGLGDLESQGKSGGSAGRVLSDILEHRSNKGHSKASTMSISGESVASSKTLPPHLVGRVPTSMANSKPISEASSDIGEPAGMGHLPPHLRTHQGQLDSSASVSTATTLRKDRENSRISRQIPFNAWDPTGAKHQGVKSPTTASTMSSAASISSTSNSSATHDDNVIGDWSSVPNAIKMPETRGKWVKSSETRIPQSEMKKQPILTHTSATHIDPDIDRQRRMNYCDSDDSDY